MFWFRAAGCAAGQGCFDCFDFYGCCYSIFAFYQVRHAGGIGRWHHVGMVIADLVIFQIDFAIYIEIALVDTLGRFNSNTIDDFQIQPPFLCRVTHTVSQHIIEFYGNGYQQGF